MKVYFDNNALINYEEGKITVPNRIDIDYYYSYVHLDELIESGDKFESLKNRRLYSIFKLTQGNYVCNSELKIIESTIKHPAKVLELCLTPESCEIRKMLGEAFYNWGTNLDKKKIIEELEIDTRRLNNYTVDEIVMTYGRDLWIYLMATAYDNQVVIQSMFNFLDLIGFWKDKQTDKSNMARSYDANHAYFASYCDYFVTNDKRTMNKANIVYQLMECKTIALSYNDFAKKFGL